VHDIRIPLALHDLVLRGEERDAVDPPALLLVLRGAAECDLGNAHDPEAPL
jgi:hypothetical protein